MPQRFLRLWCLSELQVNAGARGAKQVPKTRLSDIGLRSLVPPPSGTVDYWDEVIPSFGCRVSQGGAKTFILKLHNSRRAIGRYPVISLSEARTEAKRLLAEKTLGKVRPQHITFQKAKEQFLDEKRKSRRPSTVKNLKARLAQHFPFKGQLADITHQELGRRLSKIKSSSEHDHALSVAKTFFTWCHNRRYISDNPVIGLAQHGHTSRSRVLTDAEVKSIWEASEGIGTFGTIVRLLILTGQRRGEIAALQWEWIDEDARTISLPASITKNGRVSVIPFGQLTYGIFDNVASGKLLFEARGKDAPFNGWSKSKAALDKLCGVKNWTLHDCRRYFATTLASLGTPIHVVEKLLNHVSGTISGVAAIYNRHHFQDEMREAVAKYDAHLTALFAR